MEDGPGSYGELIGTGFAAPDVPGRDPVGMRCTKAWTDRPFGPSLGAEEVFALALGGEPLLQVEDVHASLL